MQSYHLTDEFTDIPAEQFLLASLAQSPELYWDLVDLLIPEVFTQEVNTWEAHCSRARDRQASYCTYRLAPIP